VSVFRGRFEDSRRKSVTRVRPLLAVVFIAVGLTVVEASPVHAAPLTFDVTSTSCSGQGSIQEAVAGANANPGLDTISFMPGLNIDYSSCVRPAGVQAQDWYGVTVTDSVLFEGNGATIDGRLAWIYSNGHVNPKDACPTSPGFLTLTYAPAFAEIGNFNTANPGLTVSVRNLNLTRIPSAFLVNESASLSIASSKLNQINDIYAGCGRPMIDALAAAANVSIATSVISESWADTANQYDTGAVIAVGTGNLDVYQSVLSDNLAGRAFWGSGLSNIVSTAVTSSGGVRALGGTMNIVNSAFVPATVFHPHDRIGAYNTGTVNLVASSVSTLSSNCVLVDNVTFPCSEPGGPLEARGASATINLTDSAIGSFLLSPGGPIVMPAGGTYTSNDRTWIQPTSSQNAAAIASILPNAITDVSGLPNENTPPGYLMSGLTFPRLVMPVLSDGVNPGRLIDVVPDATCAGANALINPIDSTCITTDIFGQPRWDSNDTRNIGAIQLALSPHLDARSIGGGGEVALTWNRVPDPLTGPITGYSICYRIRGSVVPCTSVAVSGVGTLTNTISGLTDGTEYEFTVAAVNNVGDGPPSNVATATPLGPIGTPEVSAVAGEQSVQLYWTAPSCGGRSGPNAYQVVYRPAGASAWFSGPSNLIARTALIPELEGGVLYEFGVFATCGPDTQSELGTTSAIPTDAPVVPDSSDPPVPPRFAG